jgi:hypothetical protein
MLLAFPCCGYWRYSGSKTGDQLASSCRYPFRLPTREPLGSCARLLDKERLGIDREAHLHICARVPSRCYAQGSTDTLRLDRDFETRSTFSDANGNSYHHRFLSSSTFYTDRATT